MKKLILMSAMGLLLIQATVAYAAPRLQDNSVNEATEVIATQEGIDVSTGQTDSIDVNEAPESPDAIEQADSQEPEVETESFDQQSGDQQETHDQQGDSSHQDSSSSVDTESSGD